MSHCTRRNHSFLELIRTCKPKKRKQLINGATADNIKALSEIAHNTLKGNLKLPEPILKKLKRHKSSIRSLAKKNQSVTAHKSMLIQKGGFLPFLVTPFLAAAGSLAGKVLANAIGI